MAETYTQCPKCGCKLPAPLSTKVPCPACGIFPFKWEQSRLATVAIRNDDERYLDEEGGHFASLFQPLQEMDSTIYYGRFLALLLLVWWSWYLIGCDYRNGAIFGSFMHGILLTIHEAGHIFFMPFGEFLCILGGSFLQFALPLGIGIAFVVVNRDNFGAAIGVWWASVSLLDLSPYIYDALHPQLIMLGGHTGEDGPHDWIYLLGRLGQIRNAQHWGAFVHALGSVFVIVALAWAALVIWKQRARVNSV